MNEEGQNVHFEPVAVLFVPSRKKGSEIAVYPLRNDPNQVYEYSLKNRKVNCLKMVCCGCRALKERHPEDYPVPLPATMIEGGLFLTDPEHTKNPHFCTPRVAEEVFRYREAVMNRHQRKDLMGSNGTDDMKPANSRTYSAVSRVTDLSSGTIKHTALSSSQDSSDIPSSSHGVRLEDIDDETYNVFCDEILGRPVATNNANRAIIDRMCTSGDFGVLNDFDDEYLGIIPAVIVHLHSEKYILSPSLRRVFVERLISKVKEDKNPINIALQTLQARFMGFPSVMKLRELLFDELNRQVPGSIPDEHRRAMNASVPIRKSSDSIVPPTTVKTVEICQPSTSVIIGDNKTSSTLKMGNKCIARTLPNERVFKRAVVPIDDQIYDLVTEVLSKRKTLEEVLIPHHRVQVQDHLRTEMQCELWNYPKHMCPAGWRLLTGGKIIPRKSEVAEIWRVCYENLAQTHAPAKMLHYIDDRFHGIATKTYLKDATRHELFRGSRVQFHQAPRFIGFKPMQYVQIDVIDFEETLYGDNYYSQALIVTDLYSGFCFGRALSFGSDQSFIVRHLMDIFGTFAPPQGFRCWSVQSSEVIQEVMVDIEQLFKVIIKNLGLANSCTNQLVKGIYNRAEHHLGSKSRWVEALPFAIMDYNQKPNKLFEMAMSPFEIMFGRRPWKSEDVPPWIDKKIVENEIKVFEQKKNGDKENDATGKKKRKRVLPTDIVVKKELLPFSDVGNNPKDTATVSSREKIRLTLRNPYPPLFDADGKLSSAGTSHLFEPGDKVFVKNPVYDIRLRPKKPPPNPLARYFRGCILYRDDKDVNFLYKVVYWDDDANVVEAMEPQLWPAPGDGYDCAEGWFSPWDITPSTSHVAKLRAVVIPKAVQPPPEAPPVTSGARCRCGTAECKAFFNLRCPNKLSANCCNKLPKPCDYHSKPVTVGGTPNVLVKKDPFAGNLSLITFDRMRARGIKVEPYVSSYKKIVKREVESPEKDTRWGFKGGKLVAVETPPKLPQNIADRLARFTNRTRVWPPVLERTKPNMDTSNDNVECENSKGAKSEAVETPPNIADRLARFTNRTRVWPPIMERTKPSMDTSNDDVERENSKGAKSEDKETPPKLPPNIADRFASFTSRTRVWPPIMDRTKPNVDASNDNVDCQHSEGANLESVETQPKLPPNVADRLARFTSRTRVWPPIIDRTEFKAHTSNVSVKTAMKEIKKEPEAEFFTEVTPVDDLLDTFEEFEEPTSFTEPSTSMTSTSIRKSNRVLKPKKFSDDESRSPVDRDAANKSLHRTSSAVPPINNDAIRKNIPGKGSYLTLSEASSRRTELFLSRKRYLNSPNTTSKVEISPSKRMKVSEVRIPTLLELKKNMDCFRMKEMQSKGTD